MQRDSQLGCTSMGMDRPVPIRLIGGVSLLVPNLPQEILLPLDVVFVLDALGRKSIHHAENASTLIHLGKHHLVGFTVAQTPHLDHCIGCFSKNSHIRSFAEMFRADLPRVCVGDLIPGQVCPPPSITTKTTSVPSLPAA
jgi:hypothetical protein